MATTRYPTTVPEQARTIAPFDHARSAKLDELIIKLDAMPPRLRARMYRLHKRWLERHVPAFYVGGPGR